MSRLVSVPWDLHAARSATVFAGCDGLDVFQAGVDICSVSCVQVQLDVETVAAEMADLQRQADALAAQRPGDAVAGELLAALSEFTASLPLLRLLAAPQLRDRHWATILTTLDLEVGSIIL